MPALLSELLIAAWPKLVRQKTSAAVLAVSGMWLAFLVGIVLSYTLAVPFAVPWTAKGTAGVTLPSSSAMAIIFAPVYIDAVSNLLIWSGLLVELPVAMYALAKLGAISYARMAWCRVAAIPLALVLAVLLVGAHDPINVGLAAVGAYSPFELGLLLARFAQPSTHEPVSA
jgi:Sec-independent protein secretion pathway component TatC